MLFISHAVYRFVLRRYLPVSYSTPFKGEVTHGLTTIPSLSLVSNPTFSEVGGEPKGPRRGHLAFV